MQRPLVWVEQLISAGPAVIVLLLSSHTPLCYCQQRADELASAHTHLPTHTNWIICLSEISSVISRAKKKRLSPMSFPPSDTVGYYGNFTCSTHISARE
jgi:hypothetical protein